MNGFDRKNFVRKAVRGIHETQGRARKEFGRGVREPQWREKGGRAAPIAKTAQHAARRREGLKPHWIETAICRGLQSPCHSAQR
jgi:hypothetical protein